MIEMLFWNYTYMYYVYITRTFISASHEVSLYVYVWKVHKSSTFNHHCVSWGVQSKTPLCQVNQVFVFLNRPWCVWHLRILKRGFSSLSRFQIAPIGTKGRGSGPFRPKPGNGLLYGSSNFVQYVGQGERHPDTVPGILELCQDDQTGRCCVLLEFQ